VTVLVLAKAPRPGHSKTRLIPGFGADGAAALAAAALADTLDVVRRADVAHRVLVLDGSPESLPCNGFQVIPQSGGTHADRIVAAFEDVGETAGAREAAAAAVLIGMDTPQLSPAMLELDLAAEVDAWIGQAEDGGWWALGLRRPGRDARRTISGVPTSTASTGALQRERLIGAGLRVAALPLLRDVDEPADAVAVAAAAPSTRFARCLGGLPAGGRSVGDQSVGGR
jgi:glycosyltransferase A (GT-A) superfamily protein (DUF2064 family)